MSGTFNEIDVPPTLVSFAVDVASDKTMITPELKKAGNKLVLLKIERDAYDLPDYEKIMDQYAGGIGTDYRYSGMSLAKADEKIAALLPVVDTLAATDTYELMQIYELRERLIVCQAVIAHLAARKETRWHSFGENTDYPQQSEEWMKYVNSRMENGEIKIVYRDLITKENTGLNTAEKGAGER